MDNKIDRKDDEFLYQPKIHSERIRELYRIKQSTGKPMTVLVDEAIREFAEIYSQENQPIEEPVLEEAKEETWEEICEYRQTLDRLDYLKCLVELEKIKNATAR